MNKALVKKIIYRLIGVAILVGGGWYGYKSLKQGPSKGTAIATAAVQRGDVVIRAYTRGELKAVRVYPVYAPNLNGTVQVTALAPMGALAREKDLLVEYDDSELLGTIDADKLSLDTTDWNIKVSQLSMQVTKSQDQVKLLSAQYGVTRAGLEVQKNPIIDVIDAKKNNLGQEEAKRTLEQQKTDIKMREAQQDTQLQVLQQNRRRAQQQYELDMRRLVDTKTLAPMKGLVAIKQNRGGNFNFGQQMPDIRTGDTLQAGMNVMDILDLSEMELSAKVGELDRANLKEGQPIMIQLDSVPDKRFPGKIKTLSGTAVSDVFSGDPSKKFDVTFSIDMRTLLSGLGMKDSDVNEIMNTAAENAKKNLISFAPQMAGGGGGRGGRGDMGGGGGMGGFGGGGGMGGFGGGMGGFAPGGFAPDAPVDAATRAAALQAMQGAQGGRQGGGQAAGQGRQGGQNGQGRGGFMSNMSDEDRQKLADIRQKMQGASDADQEKLRTQQQEIFQKYGMGRGRGGDNAGGGQGRGDMAAGGRQGGFGGGQGRGDMAGGGRQGGFGGGQGRGGDMAAGGRQGGPGGVGLGGATFNPTQEERDKAKLPPPPEQDSEITKLLRPGLLADVEVEVEKIPNAIHVPKQAVMEKNNQTVVFVQNPNGKFSQRVVKVLKQSESMSIIESGVQPGELVAMSDPTANKNDKSKTEEKKGTSATSMMPGGK